MRDCELGGIGLRFNNKTEALCLFVYFNGGTDRLRSFEAKTSTTLWFAASAGLKGCGAWGIGLQNLFGSK